jgi:hypothetical protein
LDLKPDPEVFIQAMMSRIPERDLRAYLEDALRAGSIYTLLAQTRRRAVKGVYYLGQEDAAEIAHTASRKKSRTPWEKLLRSLIPVEGGGYRYLRDATLDDLKYQASVRREKAASLLTEAKTWEYFVKVMSEQGVATFGELSEEVLTR